ncbi:MAG: ABC transporter permease subunit [Phycisphaerales bacterium]
MGEREPQGNVATDAAGGAAIALPPPARRGLGEALAGLLPHRVLLNAVFQKEVRVSGRKVSTFWLRGVYGLLQVGLAVLVYAANRSDSYQGGAAAIQSFQDVAPAVTASILWFQMILLPLVSAMMTAPTVCDEVRGRTLGALLTTPLTAAQIVGGKFAGALVNIAILGLISLPLLLGMRLFGGTDATLVLGGSAVIITTAMLAGAIGVLMSVFARRSALASSGAASMVVGLAVAPLLVSFLLVSRHILSEEEATFVVGTMSGPAALGITQAISLGMPAPAGVTPWTIIGANVAFNLVATGGLLAAATLVLRKRLTGDGVERVLGAADVDVRSARRAKKAKGGEVGALEAAGAPAGAVAVGAVDVSGVGAASDQPAVAATPPPPPPPLPDASIVSREVSDRPVLWRELRRQGERAASRRRGLAGASFVLVLLAILGVFLPLWGMFSQLSGEGGAAYATWSRGGRLDWLSIGTIGFVLLTGGLIAVTAVRAIKRAGTGQAVVLPPRSTIVCAALAGLLMFLYWESEGEFDGVHMFVAVLGSVIVLLRAASQSAGVLAEEREGRTLETLLTTRLSAREILLGKLAGALARQWDLAALILAHFLFAGVLLDGLTPWVVFHVAAALAGGVAFLGGTGVVFSLMLKKGSVAAIANTGLALGLWLVAPIVLLLLAQALRADSEVFDKFWFGAFGTQPLPLLVFAVTEASNASRYGRLEYSLPWLEKMDIYQFTALLVVVSALYAGLGMLAIRFACARFNRLAGRSS